MKRTRKKRMEEGSAKKCCKREDQRQRAESDRNNKENERKRKKERERSKVSLTASCHQFFLP